MWEYIIIPVVGAFIGWMTNKIAIKLIFRPYRALEIPLIKCRLQGLIPKRHGEIAHTMGEVVEKDLVSFNELILKFNSSHREQIIKVLVESVNNRVKERLPIFLPSFFKNGVTGIVEDLIRREFDTIWTSLVEDISNPLNNSVSVSKIVEEKILSLDLKNLERIIVKIVSKELRHIECLGAVLGFLIGMVQVVVVSIAAM